MLLAFDLHPNRTFEIDQMKGSVTKEDEVCASVETEESVCRLFVLRSYDVNLWIKNV